jgi:peptide deformylase
MKIVHYPHPSLRHAGKPLTAIDNKVRKAAEEMLNLMYEAKGLGLAAPQVALPYQMFVMNTKADPEQRELEKIIINPVIVERKGSIEGDEGCLSFPELFQKVRRAKHVKVVAYNLEGQQVEILPTDDLESRVLQHEWDHLQGVLYIDKFGPLAKLSARTMLKALERAHKRAQEKGEIPSDAEIEKSLKELEDQA